MKYTFAQKCYLGLVCAENYPEQEPAYKIAKWYHTLWLLIPIIGFLFFVTHIETSYENKANRTN